MIIFKAVICISIIITAIVLALALIFSLLPIVIASITLATGLLSVIGLVGITIAIIGLIFNRSVSMHKDRRINKYLFSLFIFSVSLVIFAIITGLIIGMTSFDILTFTVAVFLIVGIGTSLFEIARILTFPDCFDLRDTSKVE